MEAVSVQGLVKSYGRVRALDGLDMRVEAGSICGFVGPNGAGKTTTLRILLGLLPKDQGTVKLFGQEVLFGQESPVRQKVAYLPEEPVFPERHTGLEVMELVAGLYRMDAGKARDRTEVLLKEFHLWEQAKRMVGTYSRGMRQRLGLASCLLPEPELLVLDEPVSALDPGGRVEVFDLISRLRGRATVLFSSHILDDVERVCDRLVMIRAGRNVVDGPMEEILSKYASDRIRIVVRAEDLDSARSVLAALPFVTGASTPEEGSSGDPSARTSSAVPSLSTAAVLVDVEPGMMETAVDETLRALVQQGVRVIEYGRSRTDLETVFLRLSA